MAAAEEGQAEGLRRRLELLREDMQRKDSDLQASVAEGRQLLEKVQSRRGTAATLGELRRRTEQRVRLDDRSSVSSSAAGSRLDELRAQIAALAQVNDPTTPVRSRQPSQPGSDRRRLKEVEPEVEDTCSLPASAQTPPRAVAADDLGALSRYLENLRRENDAYRQRFVAPPMPADAASGVTSTLAPRSPTSSVVVTAPPPQARGPAAAAPRRKTVLVCGSVAGSGAAFDVDEGVAEDRNLERLRWQLGIDRNTHLGVTDAAGRALRLRYDSVVPDQVCALRLTRSRSKQFWLHDCETPFVLYESLPEETLLAVKERLRLRDDTSLRFTNSAGDDVDLQYASVRDGERLRWQLHSGAAQKPRTRLRYRTISPQHGPTSPDTAQWGNLDAVRRTRDAAAAASPTPPPQPVVGHPKLWVVSKGCPEAAGVYLLGGERMGLPEWTTEAGRVLAASRRGVWALYASAAAAAADDAVVLSAGRASASSLPHTLTQWRTLTRGDWVVDAGTQVTVKKPAETFFQRWAKVCCCGGR